MNHFFSRSAKLFVVASSLAGLAFTSVSSAETPPPGHDPQTCQAWASSQSAAMYTNVYNQVMTSCRAAGGDWTSCDSAARTNAARAQAGSYTYYYNACMTS
ncbi:MAG TPA: hypothetical protein VIN58_23630 [Roseateles sp.]